MAPSRRRASCCKSLAAVFVVAHLTSPTLAAQSMPQQLLALAGYVIAPSNHIQPPGIAEQESIVARAKQLANERTRDLPNFFCDMSVQRSDLRIKSGRAMWKPITKEILVRVRFVGWREDYKTLRIGQRRSKKPFTKIGKGRLSASGQFGGFLMFVNHMKFRWLGRARLGGRSVYVFDVTVPKNVNTSPIQRNGRPSAKVGYRGIICIEEESSHSLAIALEAVNIPSYTGIEMVSMSVVYSETPIGEKSFLLPISAESLARVSGDPMKRQSTRYRNYKRFDVESNLQFEKIESKVTYGGQVR